MKQLCEICGSAPKKPHFNSKYCASCSDKRRRKPIAALTRCQERQVRKLAGTMYAHLLAEKVGVSVSRLKRWARDNKLSLDAHKYDDKTVASVCAYYVEHGKPKTQKKFPNVKVRSIVERYLKDLDIYKPRQVRWDAKQIIMLARMAGLVSKTAQAAYFSRPRANEGSIKSAWSKKFSANPSAINGAPAYIVRRFVKRSCPYYEPGYCDEGSGIRRIALWIDIVEHMREDVPHHLRKAFEAQAKFQKWLHGSSYRSSIRKILQGDL